MKIAICFSGQPRFVKEGYKLFKKNLIGFNSADIFFHTWTEKNLEGNNHNLTRHDDIQEILKLYKITDYISETQKYDIAPQGISHKEFVHWSMFYSIYQSNKIKKQYENKHNIKYDFVIRTRFDCALLETLDVTKYSDNLVYAPWIHKHNNTIMDWLNFSNSQIMDKYVEVFNNLHKYKTQNIQITSGESLLSHHLNTNNVKYKSCNIDCKLIRTNTNANPNTWVNINQL